MRSIKKSNLASLKCEGKLKRNCLTKTFKGINDADKVSAITYTQDVIISFNLKRFLMNFKCDNLIPLMCNSIFMI